MHLRIDLNPSNRVEGENPKGKNLQKERPKSKFDLTRMHQTPTTPQQNINHVEDIPSQNERRITQPSEAKDTP